MRNRVERVQRGAWLNRGRGPIGVVVLAGLVLAGCANGGKLLAPKHHHTTTTTAPVTTTSSATGTTVAGPPGPPCGVSVLEVTQGPSGAGASGSANIVYEVTNISRKACSLDGYPTIQLVGVDGANLPTTEQQGGSEVPSTFTVQTVNLVPRGGQASFYVSFQAVPSNSEPTCTIAPKMKLAVPGSAKTLTAPAEIQACGGIIEVSPFQPGLTAATG